MKRMLSLVLTLCLLSSLLPVSALAEQQATRTIVDQAGNEVTIPRTINRVAITSVTPLPSIFCLFMGSADKLVGIHPSSKNTGVHSMLARAVPGIADVPTTFYQGADINVEELIKLDPDVVFYFKGKEEEKSAIESAGIPAVAFDPFYGENYSILDTTRSFIEFLGEIFGEQGKAEQYIAAEQRIVELVNSRIATLPEEERNTAMVLVNYNDSALIAGGSTVPDFWINTTGGINVGKDQPTSTVPVNMEQIYQWNPDVIFLNSFSAFTPEDLMANTAVEGHDWSGLKAVQDKRVYKIPLGMFYWYANTYDAPLALLWMAKMQHPELFEDVDMDQEIRDHYRAFYNLELTDEDLETLYNPPAESAMG